MPPNKYWRRGGSRTNVSLTLYPQAAPFLPNPSVDIGISDLTGARRGEAVISMWGGHVGTTGKKIRFNGNSWIAIRNWGARTGFLRAQRGVLHQPVPPRWSVVPISNLHSGTNYLKGQTPANLLLVPVGAVRMV